MMAKTASSVLLPIIRRVMPNFIAAQIIGVQPMSGPAGSIFGLSSLGKREIPFTKGMYRKFLRLNDRKKTQTLDNLIKAKYFIVYMKYAHEDTLINKHEIKSWCDQQYGPQGYAILESVWGPATVILENSEDQTMFLLNWGDKVDHC